MVERPARPSYNKSSDRRLSSRKPSDRKPSDRKPSDRRGSDRNGPRPARGGVGGDVSVGDWDFSDCANSGGGEKYWT